jgi:nucleotide-binding universal stress UspA family protein
MLATVAPALPGGSDPAPSLLRQGRSILLRQSRSVLQHAADGLGPDPELRVEFGEPAERLGSLAQRERAALLVVAVQDRAPAAGRWLGSVYLALAGTVPCPVAIVPPSVEDLSRAAGPIVCGVDGSDHSLAAVGVAVGLARRLAVPVQLVHVATRPRLSGEWDYGPRLLGGHAAAMRVLLRAANVPQSALDLRVELGEPAERLADVAAREGALLIVNGSRGRGRSALLGSVSSGLARTASQPVVLVGARVGRLDRDGRRERRSARLWTSLRRSPAYAGRRGSVVRTP